MKIEISTNELVSAVHFVLTSKGIDRAIVEENVRAICHTETGPKKFQIDDVIVEVTLD